MNIDDVVNRKLDRAACAEMARGKTYDALITVKLCIPSICDDFDLSAPDAYESFTTLVTYTIQSESLWGLADDEYIEIVNIEQIEHNDYKKEMR